MNSTTTAINLGNNETIFRSIVRENNGTFTAITFTASRNFKTYAGAVRWMARRS
jgi:hypothetical protein